MQVAQWDSTYENDNMSGLHRLTTELYRRTSAKMVVKRYFYQGFNAKSFRSYQAGDVTHITTQNFAFLGYFKHVKNCVVTVNDLIPQHWYNRLEKIRHKWILTEFILDKAADHYITISDYVKQDLMDTFGIDDDKITRVYPGVDHVHFYPRNKEEAREKFGLDQDKTYALAVSSNQKWKNLKILDDLPYDIIGIGYGRGCWGYVPDENMPDLYSACDVFLAPSKAEGFCLPAVEAMACGCPVVYSDATALPEVVGYAGANVPPDSKADWIINIEAVLKNRSGASKRAIERAAMFNWDKCAKETLDVYRSVAQ